MIYVVIPFESDEALRSKLEELKEEDSVAVYDDEAPHAYFVSFHGTTRELAKTVGYDDDRHAGMGIVIPVSNYFGLASQDLWEWLELYKNGG